MGQVFSLPGLWSDKAMPPYMQAPARGKPAVRGANREGGNTVRNL